MQTQVVKDVQSSVARLECLTASCGLPERIPLIAFPFKIGRTSSADLQIDSTWVSREHTLITRERNEFRAQDRGSTNGTFLNGVRVDEAQLTDGDVLGVGDVKFTFKCKEEQHGDGLKIQVMGANHTSSRPSRPCELVQHLRRGQEVLLHQANWPRLSTVIKLDEDRPVGVLVTSAAASQQNGHADACRRDVDHGGQMATRLRLIARMSACERQTHLAGETGATHIFVRIDPCELEDWYEFGNHMCLLRAMVPAESAFVIDLPAGCRYEMHQRRRIKQLVKELEAELAYHDFAGSHVQLMEYADPPPSFITLRSNMMQRSRPRHRKQHVTKVLAACSDLGASAIVDAGGSGQQLLQWKKWGLQFAVSACELQDGMGTACAPHATD